MASAMMEQYRSIKAQYRDALLLFRLGDFYELFESDAKLASRLLGLTLTQRQGTPMCGFPHHAAQGYIAKLLAAGRKAAVCEQVSDPRQPGLTERKVVEVLSPGSVYDNSLLDAAQPNLVLCLSDAGEQLACAWCDASTGELWVADRPTGSTDEDLDTAIRALLASLAPRELIVAESLVGRSPHLAGLAQDEALPQVNRLPDWTFDQAGPDSLQRILGTGTLRGFGVDAAAAYIGAATVLLDYLAANAGRSLSHIRSLKLYRVDSHVQLDEATIRSLELFRTASDGTTRHALITVLDAACTGMGSRLIRSWLGAPLTDLDAIHRRHDRVGELVHRSELSGPVRAILRDCHDLQRLAGRLGVGKAHPKDLRAIADTAGSFGELAELIVTTQHLTELAPNDLVTTAMEIAQKLDAALAEAPPIDPTDGGVFREGYDAELDRLRGLAHDGGAALETYLEQERANSGLPGLRLGRNRVLGYYLELSKTKAAQAPEHLQRRQSLANVQRFATEQLSALEREIATSEAMVQERERGLLDVLLGWLNDRLSALLAIADRLAAIDAVAGLAAAAVQHGYVRPQMHDDRTLCIVGGRHPVVEAYAPSGSFVPNDLDLSERPFALVTGPNMAGKSTVLRQSALIVLMAQAGSFVPAQSAAIGLCDAVFCRVGASDNLARGESTFLVEMIETSNILRNAGARSLVIMDEVGRGTSTQDGLAIAWAVCETLLDHIACRTLFATHYHELLQIEHSALQQLHMKVAHGPSGIVFLRELAHGGSDRSFGTDVARLAGLPPEVVARAEQLLAQLRSGTESQTVLPRAELLPEASQGLLFAEADPLRETILAVNPDELTPRQAHELLYELRARAQTTNG